MLLSWKGSWDTITEFFKSRCRKYELPEIILKMTPCYNMPLQVAGPGWNKAGEWHLDGGESRDVCKAQPSLHFCNPEDNEEPQDV